MIKFTDVASQYEADVTTYVDDSMDNVHVVEINFEITCIEDLIMALREGVIDCGYLEYPDSYQFNGFYICGSDLIDIVKAYGL